MKTIFHGQVRLHDDGTVSSRAEGMLDWTPGWGYYQGAFGGHPETYRFSEADLQVYEDWRWETGQRKARVPERLPFELTFVGGLRGDYPRWHATYESAEREALRILARITRAARPAIVYGPKCGPNGVTIS